MTVATDAYGRTQKLACGPRDALAAAFAKAAARLMAAARRPGDYADYADAVERNRLLWTLLQADVADAANALPAEFKDDLLSLSLYVDRQTVAALARPGRRSLEPLIVIDRDLARGLGA